MSTPAAALLIDIRRRANDSVQRTYSPEDVFAALNDAAHWVQGEMGSLHNRTSLSLVKDQREYGLNVTVQKPTDLEYIDASGAHPIDSMTEIQWRQWSMNIRRATIPRRYHMLETERVLLLDPIPDTAAPATTINQGGGITSTATSMVVTSTTNFPTEGRILIDSEVIGYTLATNTAPITVSGMTRGLEGTTAATHTNAAAITLRNLFVWGQRMYQDMEMRNYYITGTAAFTNASTTVTGTTTAWANGQVSAGDMIGITANATTTMPRKWYTIASIATDTSLTLTSAYAEPNYSTNTYIISSPNPFPGYCDGMLKAYATSMLIKKTGRLDLANIEFVTARTLLATAMQNQRKSDTFLHARTVDSYGANTRMPLWIRNSRV